MRKCIKCDVQLEAGENWWESSVRQKRYICNPCDKRRRRPLGGEKPTLTLVKNNPPKPAAQPMRKRVGGTMEGEVVPQGWVYMIANPEIPHLLKIGRTYPDGIDSRLSEAQRWGRAILEGKFWFDDANEAEKRIHAMLYKWNLRTMGYTDCGKELFHVSTSMVEKVVEEYNKELESGENAVC